MCPLNYGEAPQKPAGRPRANLPNWRTMRWLDEERERRNLSLRDVAGKLGYQNATRLGQYFRQKIIARPDMVRRLALAVGVSPIEALWRCGHYAAIFDDLENLYRLSWAWMREDLVSLDQETGANFAWQCAPAPGSAPVQVDTRKVPRNLATRYHQATVYNDAGIFTIMALPRPMAYAILLAVGIFPRRGDTTRSETKVFIERLAPIASHMLVGLARLRVPPELSSLRKPLNEAERILPWRFYPASTRLAIAAEYVHAWCETLCRDYANYARLALYNARPPMETAEESDNMWDSFHATIPSLEDLRADAAESPT